MFQLEGLVALLQLDATAERLETQERPRPEEAVAPESLTADNALEEKRPISLLDLAEGTDRRQRVAGQLAVDRHQVALARQADELVEGRMVAHESVTVAIGRSRASRQVHPGGLCLSTRPAGDVSGQTAGLPRNLSR